MQVEGAVIREQGITFAVVVVKSHVVHNDHAARQTIAGLIPAFRMPVVLMAQTSDGSPTYYGRKDIARFMASVPLGAIPWRRYTIN
jgi:Zn-dependent protease with chaperone function